MSLANRLSLLFGLIVAGAIGAVLVLSVPDLESSLRSQKLRALSDDAAAYSEPLQRVIGTDTPDSEVQRIVREAAARSSTRVTLLGVATGTQRQAYLLADSARTDVGGRRDQGPEQAQFPVADEALATGRVATGTEPTRTGRIGEAARPLTYRGRIARIVVFSDSLGDVQATVALVRRRILVAGVFALLLAVAAGYLVARALSERVKRLEEAARKVAAGDFATTITTDGDDELSQLARAFADMQRQLAQLDSARSSFIATASHELRTPIFSLSGFLELLADEELDEDTRREFIAQLRGQVERLRKLSVELLDLSRMEAGQLRLRPEPTDCGRLASEVAEEFLPLLGEHAGTLRVRLPDDPVEAEVDPDRVAQVIRILLDNAVVHTPPGTDILVSVGRRNGAVRFEVADRGPGIDRQAMTRIFEPFFKSAETPGAGLGLTIAAELAERMDGRLAVERRGGRTRFSFELPA